MKGFIGASGFKRGARMIAVSAVVATMALPACNCGENNTPGNNGTVGSNNGTTAGTNNGTTVAPNNGTGEAGVTVSPTQLQTTESGGTADFTVVLTSEPSGEVVVSVASSDENEGTLSVSELTFDENNWDQPQTVTVTGVDDDVADGNVDFTVTTEVSSDDDSNYDGFEAADVNVTNVDDDMATIDVMSTSVTVNEEGATSQTVTVTIGAMPSEDVTISIAPADDTQVSVDVDTLTFSEANESLTFTVTATDDDVVEQNPHNTTIALGVSTGDTAYAAIDPTDVAVTIIDNDSAEISVVPTAILLGETGTTTATYTVSLGTAPTDTVTIDVSSSDTTEAVVSPAQITLDANTLSADVTVTSVDDGDVDGAQVLTVVNGIASSNDTAYDGIDVGDVSVTVTDDDQAEITVNPTNLTVLEANSGQATFDVSLSSAPGSDVVINLAASSTDVTLDTTTLTFDSSNWSTAQTVTITADDDQLAEGNEVVTIVTTLSTQDAAYTGRPVADVIVQVIDDDLAQVSVNPTNLTFSENGGSGTFDINIGSAPSADVTIDLASSDTSEATVSPASITFAANTAPTARTVTVTGVDDAEADGPASINIVTTLNTTAGEYTGLSVPDVNVTVTDDDQGGYNISQPNFTILEGTTATATLALNSAPTSPVTINFASLDSQNVTVSPASLQWTAADFATAKTVTFTAVDDALADGPQTVTVTTTVNTSDAAYAGLNPADFTVTATDNDVANFTVTQGPRVTTEAGGTATFTVALTAAPSDTVTVQATSNDTTEGRVTTPAGGALVFDSLNWQTGIPVIVTGQDDNDQDGAVDYQVLFAPAVSNDGAYATKAPSAITFTNLDNEAGFSVATSTGGDLTVDETGTTDTFTVVLNAQPTSNVDVVVSAISGYNDEWLFSPTVAPTTSRTLIFTPQNYATPQTVTIQGIQDVVIDGEQDWQISVAIGGNTVDPIYQGQCGGNCLAKLVDGTTFDDDAAGITVSPATSATIGENTCTTFEVIFGTPPLDDVDIVVTLPDTDGDTNPDTDELEFSNTNGTTDTLTISSACTDATNCKDSFEICAVDDALPQATQAYTVTLSNTVSDDTANDPYHDLPVDDVTVTVTDDDTPAIAVQSLPTNSRYRTRVTYEDGTLSGQNTFRLRPATPIGGSVTVQVTSGDITEGLLSTNGSTPSQTVVLTFNENGNSLTNWQTVTIVAQDDADTTSQRYDINFSILNSQDTFYQNVQIDPLPVVNIDNDAAGWTVVSDETQPFQVAEGDGTADAVWYRIFSNTTPAQNVTVDFAVSDTTEGFTNRFGSGNGWVTDETAVYANNCTAPCFYDYRVRGTQDQIQDGPVSWQVAPTSLTTTAPAYIATTFPTIQVVTADDDSVGIRYCDGTNCPASEIPSVTFSETGGDTVYVELSAQPETNTTVVLDFTSADVSEFTINGNSQLTFTDGNWNQAQPIVLEGETDNAIDGDISTLLVATINASTTSASYTGTNPGDLNVTVEDTDAGVIEYDEGDNTQDQSITLVEGGNSQTISVVLATQPTADVVIPVSIYDTSVATIDKASLTFTSANWSTPQVVTISPTNDVVNDGPQNTSVVFDISTSADGDYNGIPPTTFTVTTNDDDAAGVLITQPSNPPYLVVDEDGMSDTFEVALLSAPAAGKTVTIVWGQTSSSQQCVNVYETSAGGVSCARGVITPGQTTFDSSNWSTPQTVTVTGQNDGNTDTYEWFSVFGNINTGATNHDAAYTGVEIVPVIGVDIDDDQPAVAVLPNSIFGFDGTGPMGAAITGENGASDTVWVRLTQQPTSQVNLAFAPSDGSVATVTGSVSISPANYRNMFPLTVAGQNADDVATGDWEAYEIEIDVTVPTGGDADYDALDNGGPLTFDGYNADNDECQLLTLPTSANTLDTLHNDRIVPGIVALSATSMQAVNVGITSTNTLGATPLTSLVSLTAGAEPRQVWFQGDDPGEVGNISYAISTSDACYTPATTPVVVPFATFYP